MDKTNYAIEQEPHLGGYIHGGDYHTYMNEIWDWMIDNGVKSVIDVGCGEGYSTKYFYDHGCKVLGIEGGINAYNNNVIKEHIVLHDYTKGSYITDDTYDAIWSCEFVEHVEEKYMSNFLDTFLCADKIFMTHANIGQDGYHHVNCKPEQYWISNIENIGFKFNKELSVYLRSISQKDHAKRILYFQK